MNEPNGNGHTNGTNGHQKIFDLVRTTDPDTIAVLQARRDCRSDDRLTRSMKACFDEVADRALNPSFFDVKGIVTISDSVLAETFGVTNRTVYTWKRRIEECGYVSLAQKFKSNMWPLTTYRLTCLHKAPRQVKTDADGTFGGRKFRSAPANPGLGARHPGQTHLPLAGSRPEAPDAKSEKTPAISGLSRKTLRVSPEANFGSEPKPISGESRNPLRARAEVDFRHKKAEVLGSGIYLGGEAAPAPPDRSFEEWKRRHVTGAFASRLERMEQTLKLKLASARSDAAKAGLRRQLQAVRDELLPPVADEPKPVKATKPATAKPVPMSEDKIKALWAANKPALARA